MHNDQTANSAMPAITEPQTPRPRTLPELGVWTTINGQRVLVDPTPDELADEIRHQFHQTGTARTSVAKRAFSARQWQTTARLVARREGRAVQTMQDGANVRARLKDSPRDDRETAIHHERIRQWITASKMIRDN